MVTLIERVDGAVRARRSGRADVLAVFVVALAARLALVATSSGGFTGNYGYDAGVYYASADALIHGRVPYADYLLLHPPGLTLTLTPFALLGRLTTDHTGFIAGNVAFSALGALNAALIVVIARRLGLGRRASLLGGGFYAVWLSAVGPEISARLEPLGTFAFLAGVLLLSGRRSNRLLVGAGAALGFAVTVKIWWLVPLLVLVGWYAVAERDRAVVTRLLAGAAATLAVVLGPFFVMSPGPMWRMIVADQVGRHSVRTSPVRRIFEFSSLDQFGHTDGFRVAAVSLFGVVVVGLVLAACRRRAVRPLALVFVAQAVVLLLSPTYFGFYSGYGAAATALVVAGAAAPGVRSRPWPVLPAIAGVVAAAVTITALVSDRPAVTTSRPLPVGTLPAAVAQVPCVMADSPIALIALDALSRGLARGCPNWVDVSGRTYDSDAASNAHVSRPRNERWQADLLRYLRSGQAVIVIRTATGLSPATRRTIDELPVLARSGRLTVYRVVPEP